MVYILFNHEIDNLSISNIHTLYYIVHHIYPKGCNIQQMRDLLSTASRDLYITQYAKFAFEMDRKLWIIPADGHCQYHCCHVAINKTKSSFSAQRKQRQYALEMMDKYPEIMNHPWVQGSEMLTILQRKYQIQNGGYGGIICLILLSIYHKVLFEVMSVKNDKTYVYFPYQGNEQAQVFDKENIRKETLLQYAEHYDYLGPSKGNNTKRLKYHKLTREQWVTLWMKFLDIANKDS